MHTFKKEERLCNKKLLEQLFHKGSSFLVYPYRVSFLKISEALPAPVQVVFPVAKKRFKRAVDRNLIKRRIREAYRLNKQILLYNALSANGQQLLLSISYIGKEIPDFKLIEDKMKKVFGELLKAVTGEVAE